LEAKDLNNASLSFSMMQEFWRRVFSLASLRTLSTFVFLLFSLPGPLAVGTTSPLNRTDVNSNPIQIENSLPGTSSWQLSNPAPYDNATFDFPAIEGYAWTTSVVAGDEVTFSVSTTASSFKAEVYRMGWYQGQGGRFIKRISNIPGHAYGVPPPDKITGLIEANWRAAFTLPTNNTWVSGMYMVKLTASNGFQSYIPFVLRSSVPADFAFIHAVNTDEAYNMWGGNSLYENYKEVLGAKRAYEVSFDRPFWQDTGAGQFFYWEYPMVRWLEKNGYDVTYLSDLDVQNNPHALLNHRALLIVGHSEYWSKYMRDNVQAAINNGVNLGVFAADTFYWQVRYEPRRSNPSIPERILVCYKDKNVDPLYGKDDRLVTVLFRDDPLNRPEQSLLGAMYGGYFALNPRQQGLPWVVQDASSWVFAGTGLKKGDELQGLIGYEYDKVNQDYPQPAGDTILSSSPVSDINNNRDISTATLYTAKSGARVFDAATMQWSWGLDNSTTFYANNNVVSKAAQQITENILQNFLTVGNKPQPQSNPPVVSNRPQSLLANLETILLFSLIILTILYALYFSTRLLTRKFQNIAKPSINGQEESQRSQKRKSSTRSKND
jgi:hypothetical protein